MPELPVLPPDAPATILTRLNALEAYVASNDARIAALESNLTRVETDQPDPDELGRVRWFMKHGRRRPW